MGAGIFDSLGHPPISYDPWILVKNSRFAGEWVGVEPIIGRLLGLRCQ